MPVSERKESDADRDFAQGMRFWRGDGVPFDGDEAARLWRGGGQARIEFDVGTLLEV